MPRGAQHDLPQLLLRVEVQALHDAEAVAQRRRQEPGACRRADQRKRRQLQLDRARGRALADHDVQLVILHRRIKDFLDDRAQTVDLVHEQHIARLQIGQDRGQVARPLEHRARSLAQADAEFVRDDVRERRLAEARRAEDQYVIERLAAAARRLDEDAHLLLHGGLPDVLGQLPRPHRAFECLVLTRGQCRNDPVLFDHRIPCYLAAACRARRINSSVPAPSLSTLFSSRVTSAGRYPSATSAA